MTDKQPEYYVTISDEGGHVEERMGPFTSERKAERVKAGVDINLDHWNYVAEVDICWD